MNPTTYITPEKAKELGDERSIEVLRALAEADPGECDVCGEEAWKYGGTGMCFTCTTGEADGSGDLEIGL